MHRFCHPTLGDVARVAPLVLCAWWAPLDSRAGSWGEDCTSVLQGVALVVAGIAAAWVRARR